MNDTSPATAVVRLRAFIAAAKRNDPHYHPRSTVAVEPSGAGGSCPIEFGDLEALLDVLSEHGVKCSCGASWRLGTVHTTDRPCWVPGEGGGELFIDQYARQANALAYVKITDREGIDFEIIEASSDPGPAWKFPTSPNDDDVIRQYVERNPDPLPGSYTLPRVANTRHTTRCVASGDAESTCDGECATGICPSCGARPDGEHAPDCRPATYTDGFNEQNGPPGPND